MFVNLGGGEFHVYRNKLWLVVPRRGAGERGAEAASHWPRVVRKQFFCLVADWSQPYVILEAARGNQEKSI